MDKLEDYQKKIIELTKSSHLLKKSFVKILLNDSYWVIDLDEIRGSTLLSNLSENIGHQFCILGISNVKNNIWTIIDTQYVIQNKKTIFDQSMNWALLLKSHNIKENIALLWSEIIDIRPQEEFTLVPNSSQQSQNIYCKQQWLDAKNNIWLECNTEAFRTLIKDIIEDKR